MPLHVQPARGLANLRTLATRADERMPTHKAYLRISFLELERARHGQEMKTAQRRLEFMHARCRSIDAEKAEILASTGQAIPPAPGGPALFGPALPGPAQSGGAPGNRRKQRFQLSY